MRFGHRRHTATALAVAVIGGLLGGAPTAGASVPSGSSGVPLSSPAAVASPRTDRKPADREQADRKPSGREEADRERADRKPRAPRAGAVHPVPQSLRTTGKPLRLGERATLVIAPDTDPHTGALLRRMLEKAGIRTLHTALPGRGPLLLIGGDAARDALRALDAPDRSDLPDGGYRLAVGRTGGRDTVALDGVGASGLFHGAQTLRQLITGEAGRATVRRATVRDWPGTPVRGVTEGFYGEPWTHAERLAHLDFLGRTKQNRYLLAPGDDPYRQTRWRDPYPTARQAEFRELAERARRNHVTLAWAVAPAQRLCFSDDGDIRALSRKLDAMAELGFGAFQLQFPDVSYSEWHCERDARTFGSGPGAAARAQARVANAVARETARRHPGAPPLSLLPTEYYQDGATAYRRALAEELDQGIEVAWTGVGVVPRTITGGETARAREIFGRPLVTMDNYPVNDYAEDRLFLGPVTGREPAVATGSAALLPQAMRQATASQIPLFTSADYAWNPRGYRPGPSWEAAVAELAGADPRAQEALRALAGHQSSSVLDPVESLSLRPLIDAFWRLRGAGGESGPPRGKDKGTSPRGSAPARDRAAAALRDGFTVLSRAPERLRRTAGGRLADETRPWLDQLARYGRAGELAVDMLQAQARGDGERAWRAALDLEPLARRAASAEVTVGAGVLGPFLKRALAENAAWTGADRVRGGTDRVRGGGADRAPDGAGRDMVRLARARPVSTVTALTEPGPAPGRIEGRVPGEGWRPLGTLSPGGWTQVDARGLRLDAIRVVPTGPAPGPGSGQVPAPPRPAVRALVPWFADEPAAGLELGRDRTDAVIGGAPQRAEVRLTPRRPGAVRGKVTAKAPAGITVRAPRRTTVPRGVRTTVPVEVSVPKGTPSGEYRVPLSFASQRETLTVRAYPRTAGPDLLRAPGTTASSSGDETPDFPAPAAVDGDPGTRWSSPAEDGAWWQAALPHPVRLGRVVLHWQDAYAVGYRVQVSSDGRVWRTAATVREGRGGRESIRLDSRARYLRIQGDERATRFGYSLWSVEAYAVAEKPSEAPGDGPRDR
ncbi:beta-N-acetylglucosaminidase domain-containing protein [Streptomyces sp. NPDC000594]|uniref:beta-N-acetylglucosaminidase domain-containing protein n=1 Tax=Streptomyces sp. NPDC000594 TaxID=3154261 RepID=UPI0033246BE0